MQINFKVLMGALAFCVVVLILVFRSNSEAVRIIEIMVSSLTLMFLIIYANDNKRIADYHVQQFRALFINVYLEQFGQRIAGAKRDIRCEIQGNPPEEKWPLHKKDILRYLTILLGIWPDSPDNPDDRIDRKFLQEKKAYFEEGYSESSSLEEKEKCEEILSDLIDQLKMRVAKMMKFG